MMKTFLTIILLTFSSAVIALPCTTPPKAELRISEVYVAVTEDGSRITLAWPSTNPDTPCCQRSELDPASWREIFRQRVTPGNDSINLTAFLLSLPEVGPPLTVAEQQRCLHMFTKIRPPIRVVRNGRRADGSRPMFTLNASGALVNLRVAGAQVYVEAGRDCERTPVISTTSDGLWLYVTNVAGVRGISLCK